MSFIEMSLKYWLSFSQSDYNNSYDSILNLVVYVLICLCFVGNIYALRANLSIAIVAMVAKYNVTNESRTVSKCHFCY